MIDTNSPFFIIGPCGLTNENEIRNIASRLRDLKHKLGVNIIFKGSYHKSNRTKFDAFHGVGLEKGLELLKIVKDEFNLLVTTDVHESSIVPEIVKTVDVIQIPADLCKHTKLLFTVAETGKWINIKKGAHVSANDMIFSIEKIHSKGNKNVILTERGTYFGLSDIIVDFRNFQILKSFNVPVIFDLTHSVRILSKRSDDPKGATPEYIPLLAKCASVSGINGFFCETYFNEKYAISDKVSSIQVNKIEDLLKMFLKLNEYENI